MELLWNKIFLEQPTVPVSGESRYLPRLWVSRNEEPLDEPFQSDSSSSQSVITVTGLEQRQMENLFSHHQVSVKYKIREALKLLIFREQHVLVQFWSPPEVGKRQLLKTVDQPFGVGIASDDLCFYRRDSEQRSILVDKDHEEEDLNPLARVFRRGMPEWTSDLSNYTTKYFPQLDCAIRCNLHGYLALPVFDSTKGLCVGVLELLTSVKYPSYAFEVQQVHKALKVQHLSSPEVFDSNIPKVLYERKQIKLDKIKNILKTVCDIHRLPLAQTWTVSPTRSFVSNNKVIEKTCSSFDTRCIGKVCMSTTSLPFHVRDIRMWEFMKACQERHLDKNSSYVGKALLARGSCYVQNVTELSEDEYPLVHYARMSGLTSCFAIFLHSVEGDDDEDYVLEFFLQLNNDSRYLMKLVQTLKQNFGFASGFELGEISPVEITESPLSSIINPHTVSSTIIADTSMDSSYSDSSMDSSDSSMDSSMDSSDSDSLMDSSDSDSSMDLSDSVSSMDSSGKWCNGGKHGLNPGSSTVNASFKNDPVSSSFTDSAIVPSQSSSKQNQPDDGKKNNRRKQIRKRKIDSLTMEAVKQHIGKPLDQTAQFLGVSRSTIRRFCRKHGISSWPAVPKNNKRSRFVLDPKLSEQQRSSRPSFGSAISGVVYIMLKVKRWSCLSKKHGFSGKWWSCGKHSYLPFHGSSSVCASSSRSVAHVSNTGSLMVKASFKDEMVKFRFPVSSGFTDLENQVVQRMNIVKGKRFKLKYEDEDKDLILITCDEDLELMTSNTSIKLVIEADD